jgi:Bacterial membrane protein YfhO
MRNADIESPDPRRWLRLALVCAGPALIVASVLFSMRSLVLHPMLSDGQPDLLPMWLSRFAFLGRSLRAGHIPLWNPFEMIGYRFAADPQSGWLYAPAMFLFSLFNPGLAERLLIVINPLIAGIAIYAFLRKEGLSRAAATAGGLSVGMAMATSDISLSLPFSGMLAWASVLLYSAAGYHHAPLWSRRLMWLALGTFAWSQAASAHMSHGLAVTTLLMAAYLIASAVGDVRRDEATARVASGRVLLFLVMMPLGSLAIFIPRLAFIHASSLGGGYGGDHGPIDTKGVFGGWPFAFSATPGAYAGAAVLLGVPAAFRARRWRPLVWGMALSFGVVYVFMSPFLLTRQWFQHAVMKIPFGNVFVHDPERFRYLATLAIPILGAVGIQGLLSAPPSRRAMAALLGGGLALWIGVPLAFGARFGAFEFMIVASVAAVPVLWLLATHRARWPAIALVGVLACELVLSSLVSSHAAKPTTHIGLEGGSRYLVPKPFRPADLSQSGYLDPPAFVPTLRATPDRYLTWVMPGARTDVGYLNADQPHDWPALVMERGSLFGIHDVLGYNPIQFPRYWTYIRAISRRPLVYNSAVIGWPTLDSARLLNVRYLIVADGSSPRVPGTIVAHADGYELVQVMGWEPRVSVVPSWGVVPTQQQALLLVTAPFDPAGSAILESSPGIVAAPQPSASTGTATYEEADPEHVTVTVDAASPSIAVVRTAYDPGWSATVDGHPAAVMPTDYLLQGIPVTAGHHVIQLTYHDPKVIHGLEAGAVVWILLLGSIPVAMVTERRRRAAREPDRGTAA